MSPHRKDSTFVGTSEKGVWETLTEGFTEGKNGRAPGSEQGYCCTMTVASELRKPTPPG